MKASGWKGLRNWVAISILLLSLQACEKDGFQPDIINPTSPRTNLSISVIHFWQISPLTDSGVADAQVSLFRDVIDIQTNGNPYRIRSTDSLGLARFGQVDSGWWYIQTQSDYLGVDVDSVFVGGSASSQVFEVWYP